MNDPEPTLTIRVDEARGGTRLDAFVSAVTELPRSRAAQLVASGAVTVDGRVEAKAYRVSVGELVEARLSVPTVRRADPMPIEVLWEDDALLVADKPAGMVVHPASGVRSGTLVDALIRRGTPLAARAGEDRPGIVHRLDRDVSGVLVVAKTDAAHEALVDAMAGRRIVREYLACVVGAPSVDTGKIEAPVGRHPRHRTRMAVTADGRPAVTWFRVRERLDAVRGGAAVLEVRLETGRTHQIRTHLESIGHPVLGDPVYGRDMALAKAAGLRRPFLHAWRLAFEHPVTGEPVRVQSPLPPALDGALERLRAGIP